MARPGKKWLTRVGYVGLLLAGLGYCLLWVLEPVRHFGTAGSSDTLRSVAAEPPRDLGRDDLDSRGSSGRKAIGSELGAPEAISREADTSVPDMRKSDVSEPGIRESGEPTVRSGTEVSKTFNALVLGLDDGGARTDAIMLANVNPAERKIVLLSIPRDTMVLVPGVGMTKINHAHSWGLSRGESRSGTDTAILAVEGLLNCEIRYYVKVDFEGYKHFVDTVGGVDVDLPHQVVVNESDKTFPAGPQHLDGEMALVLVRERFTLPDGDFGRQRLQFLVIAALAQKLLHPEYIPRLPELASQIMNDVIDTNLSVTDALSLALLFKGMTAQDITYLQVPGTEQYAVDPLVKAELFYWVPDPEGIQALSDLFGQ